ncbi:hypothetical protein HK099_006645 [Clydaea vesicula]|uniref:Uncharacterized protein n=1 Tax=Clydaea vesicula TaxID=447962 RepID=A0AAD5U789_9FUNG|nr:hypothetical protein HK099_006645 [Clydaea vesicula]
MQLLEVHAITGLLGVLIESAFNAKKITNPDENFSLLLGFNEINWIINESFIVAYSYMKLETAVFNESLKKALRITLGFIFVPFAKLRINIGVLRVQFNVTNNEQISFAHSLAFIPWGFAEVRKATY